MEIISLIGLSFLFFFVSYIAVVNTLEDLLINTLLRLLVMIFLSVPMGFLMAIFDYKPIFMIAVACISNYYRVIQKSNSEMNKDKRKYLMRYYFVGSYFYLFLLCILSYYFQKPKNIDGHLMPLWKTLFQ